MAIGQYVRNTDAVNIKQVAGAMLYLRGAKSTRSIEGLRKTALQQFARGNRKPLEAYIRRGGKPGGASWRGKG